MSGTLGGLLVFCAATGRLKDLASEEELAPFAAGQLAQYSLCF
jgi:hypothetical protein